VALTGRLPTKLWIDGLRRTVAASGDFAMVLSSGDADSGAVILVCRARDGAQSAYVRANMGDGGIEWRAAIEDDPPPGEKIEDFLKKQKSYDPDLWIIELDIADPARFIAELKAVS
jgi:hypothetical protein